MKYLFNQKKNEHYNVNKVFGYTPLAVKNTKRLQKYYIISISNKMIMMIAPTER